MVNVRPFYLVATVTFPLAFCTYWVVEGGEAEPDPSLSYALTSPILPFSQICPSFWTSTLKVVS